MCKTLGQCPAAEHPHGMSGMQKHPVGLKLEDGR